MHFILKQNEKILFSINILLPETETTAYCIISTTKSKHVSINELNEIFEFLGHKMEIHEL